MALTATINEVYDLGGDRIAIVGQVNGQDVQAFGWKSAFTNFYPAASYNQDGSLKPGETPRAMTLAEKRTYCRQLLKDAYLASDQAPATVGSPLGISG